MFICLESGCQTKPRGSPYLPFDPIDYLASVAGSMLYDDLMLNR